MKVGVIGLGAMGYPMALNFHKAGRLHTVWNRTASRSQAFAKETDIRPAAATVPEPQLSWVVVAAFAFSFRRLESGRTLTN